MVIILDKRKLLMNSLRITRRGFLTLTIRALLCKKVLENDLKFVLFLYPRYPTNTTIGF